MSATSPTSALVRPAVSALTIDKELSKLGFREVDEEVYYRVVASIVAGEKSGKTHFCMTAPGPIAAISTDTGTEAVAKKFLGKKRIVIRPFTSARELQQDGASKSDAVKEWTGMSDAYKRIIDTKAVRTLLIDTGSEAWELCRLARLGKLTQVMPHHYVEVNSEFQTLIKLGYSRTDLNILWIHKTKKEYAKGKEGKDSWTGKMERAGFGDMPFLVDVNLKNYFLRGRTHPTEGTSLPPCFAVEVIDSRLEMLNAVGTVLEEDMCTFPFLAETLFPDTAGMDFWE